MRWVIGILIVAALIAGAVFGGKAYWQHRFYPSPPEFDFPPALSVVDGRAQDVEALKAFGRLNRSYSDEQRKAFEAGRKKLAEDVAQMSGGQFELEIMRLLALADNGHTNLLPWPWLPPRRHLLFPVRFYWFDDGIHVVRAMEDFKGLLGARLTAIGGTPIDEAAARLRPYIGGTDAFFRLQAPWLLERPVLLYAAGLTDILNSAELTFILPGGTKQTLRLPSLESGHERYRRKPSTYLSPEQLPSEPAWWVNVSAGADGLMAFREPGKVQRYMEDRERGVAYLQMRVNAGPDLETFARETPEALKKLRPRTLIVDMRFNSGGDYTKSYDLMRTLPGTLHEDGHIYILVDKETFSAGIYSVAFLRDAAGERSTLIGGPLGDRGRFWAEGGFLELPNAKFRLWYNTAMHDVENGCYDLQRCYWLNFLYQVEAGPLGPEVAVPLTFADYAHGRDAALEKALELAGHDPAAVRLAPPHP